MGHPDPSVAIYFTPKFFSYLEIDSGGPLDPKATDISKDLADALGADNVTLDRAKFQKQAEQEGALDISKLGSPVSLTDEERATKRRRSNAFAVTVFVKRVSEASPELRVRFGWFRRERTALDFVSQAIRTLLAFSSLSRSCMPVCSRSFCFTLMRQA